MFSVDDTIYTNILLLYHQEYIARLGTINTTNTLEQYNIGTYPLTHKGESALNQL